jgi:serine/threonine protein kinase
MDINELCINCFKPTGGEEVCMHCGYIQADKPKQICHLYPHTILHNKYIIGRVINNGGFGVVYKAYDMHLDTVVAIKELLPTQNSMVTRMPPSANVIPVNDERNEAFKNYKLKFMEEARIMAQFSNCDSIVHIYDFFEENNTAYLVMEFLEGKTLREKLNENNDRIPYNEAINIMMPIMQALNLIHKSNIVHKDVSPDNIFICNDGRIKLIDFGAAKFGDNSAINDEAVVTKPGYTPPEQYRLNGEVGAYSDIYSVGAVLYTILSGRIPDESIDRIEHDNLAKLSKLGVDLPIYAEKSIMKALALKSSARFKSMDDFINAINGKKKADFPEVELKKKKILRAVIVAVALVIMILAVVIAFVVKSSNSLIPSKSTTITLWYVDNGDEDVNARWDKVTEDFEYFASKQKGELKDTKLVTVGVKSDEYDEKLKEAFDNGTAPDVYQSTSDEFEEYSYSLSEVYKEANSRVDNDYYNLMKDELKEHNQFAV